MLVVSSVLFVTSSLAASWDYDLMGEDWAEVAEECGGLRQSPIDVIFDTESSCSEALELVWPADESNLTRHFVMTNNGHTLVATPFEINYNGGGDLSGFEILHHTNDTQIKLENNFYSTYTSQVNQQYCFHSLHFHWADIDEEGSEHTYNGEAYPLEVHFVHYSCDYHVLGPAVGDYASGAAAEKYDDENVLAVIGVVFEIGEANPAIDAMLNDVIVEGIMSPHIGSEEDDNWIQMYYTKLDMADLIPDNKEYVAYLGSLTTPPCFETVRWHNMKTPMTVSAEQMANFRALLSSSNLNDTMAPNYRPPLELNDRTIYQCEEDVDAIAVIKEYDIVSEVEEIDVVEAEEDKDNQIASLTAVSIVFGLLFGIACLANCFFAYKLYGTKM